MIEFRHEHLVIAICTLTIFIILVAIVFVRKRRI